MTRAVFEGGDKSALKLATEGGRAGLKVSLDGLFKGDLTRKRHGRQVLKRRSDLRLDAWRGRERGGCRQGRRLCGVTTRWRRTETVGPT